MASSTVSWRIAHNMKKTPIDATGNRLRLKDGERLHEELCSTSLGGFARQIAAWLGQVDAQHGAGKVIQRITKWNAQGYRGVD